MPLFGKKALILAGLALPLIGVLACMCLLWWFSDEPATPQFSIHTVQIPNKPNSKVELFSLTHTDADALQILSHYTQVEEYPNEPEIQQVIEATGIYGSDMKYVLVFLKEDHVIDVVEVPVMYFTLVSPVLGKKWRKPVYWHLVPNAGGSIATLETTSTLH